MWQGTHEFEFSGPATSDVKETVAGIAAKHGLVARSILPTDTGIRVLLTSNEASQEEFEAMLQAAVEACKNWLGRRERVTAIEGGTDPRKVWVVHGRDLQLRDDMTEFLASIGLTAIPFTDAIHKTGKGSPFIGEVLDSAFAECKAVVVILSGDDVACLRDEFRSASEPEHERTLTPQPRPNVLFEAGMAFGRHPERTVLVQVGPVRPVSDLGGRHVIHLGKHEDGRKDLAQRLSGAGCPVCLDGPEWRTAGAFQARPYQPVDRSADRVPKPLSPQGMITLVNRGVPLRTGSGCSIQVLRRRDVAEYTYAVKYHRDQRGATFPLPEFAEPLSSLEDVEAAFFAISECDPWVRSYLTEALAEARKRDAAEPPGTRS